MRGAREHPLHRPPARRSARALGRSGRCGASGARRWSWGVPDEEKGNIDVYTSTVLRRQQTPGEGSRGYDRLVALTPFAQQRRAIEAPLGPVLVVAGPGAGKTYCLISRIQHLIAGGVSPHRICAVTFTNRAAEEIARRNTHDVWRGTIHAFCLALLREFVSDAGLKRGFGVADDPYQKVILSRLQVPLDRRGQLLTLFSRHRFQGYRLTDGDARLFREYVSWLRARNMVDFDELITKAEPLADRVADRWDYVLVDEFQDVNAVQYDLLKKLVEPHGNFFAVGDDEQSIFAWTGADPYVLERFRRDYDVVPIILDKNRRCSRQIFETARRVLAQNPQLFQK